jgi:hypothetical protein
MGRSECSTWTALKNNQAGSRRGRKVKNEVALTSKQIEEKTGPEHKLSIQQSTAVPDVLALEHAGLLSSTLPSHTL